MSARIVAALVLAALACGCAALQPISEGPGGSPLPGRGAPPAAAAAESDSAAIPVPRPVAPRTPVPVGTTASGGTIRANGGAVAVVDSGPSRDALAVLERIPEPLAPGERVPPPRGAGVVAPAPAAAADTLRHPGPGAAEGNGGIPVPTVVRPLGERPGEGRRVEVPDSLLEALAAGADSAARAAATDTCWRVQFLAPEDAETAATVRAAAESQLLLPVVIEREGGLHKVRTRDCLDGAGAERLRVRARASGFSGAFRFVGRRP